MAIANVFHNLAVDDQGRHLGLLTGYSPEHPVAPVAELHLPDGLGDNAVLNRVFELLNIGDDPEFGTPDPQAVCYRARRNRSLSVGDVVEAGGRFYACARTGWTPIAPPTVEYRSIPGTTALEIEHAVVIGSLASDTHNELTSDNTPGR